MTDLPAPFLPFINSARPNLISILLVLDGKAEWEDWRATKKGQQSGEAGKDVGIDREYCGTPSAYCVGNNSTRMRCFHIRLIKRCLAQLVVVSLLALLLLFIARRSQADEEQRVATSAKKPQPQPQPRRPPVVAILHQSWKTAHLPPLFANLSATFADCLPSFRRILWTDSDNRDLVARHYPWFLARYDSLAPGVQRADVARLFYMHRYGGVYCDLDCDCLRGFQHLLANTSLALGAMEGSLIHERENPAFVDEGQVENSFMYSQPRHPFFWELILRLNATQGDVPIMASGTYLLMTGIRSARRIGLDRTLFIGLPYLTVYPPSLFNPFSWINPQEGRASPDCQLFGQFTPQSRQLCRQAYLKSNASYIVQYHTQVWDKGRKNVLRQYNEAATTI
uniref:Glycosyl transferase n=1 Tax=Macrostomum lignano TaxID=282301 RepID=A0A1I8HLW6_9PLAT